MKILIGQIAISGLLINPFVTIAGNVKSTMIQLEESFGVEDTNMYTMIHARELSQELKSNCSKESIATAQTYVNNIRSHLTTMYREMNFASMLDSSWLLYEAIQDAYHRADRLSDADYCTLKFVFYSMQDRLRAQHLATLDETWIMHDFEGFGSASKIYWVQVKEDLLNTMIQENKKYKDLLNEEISFNRLNSDFKEWLSDDALTLLNKTEVLMALTVYKALYKLKNAWLFDESDIAILKDKVDFEFVESCESFHGRYELKEMIDGNWHHISYDTNGLHLKVNLCGNYFVLRDLDVILEKIVTHELGHHFYYYRDGTRGEFEDICWKSQSIRNSACDNEDFVTEYARSLSTEDYAEHFMYRFLDLIESPTSVLKEKSGHFNSVKSSL